MRAMLKRFFCWFGWHSIFVGFDTTYWDGCLERANCRWCGYAGLVDSQGNLF